MSRVFVLAALLLAAAPASAQLSGTYTVGGATPDFATPFTAAAALGAIGVSGPVTFRIRPGTYDGSFSVGGYSGASSVNAVRFQADNANDPPTLRYSTPNASQDWVFRLNGAQYVTLSYLRFESLAAPYSRLLAIDGTALGLTISNCEFVGGLGASALDLVAVGSAAPEELTFTRNVFTGGSSGLRMTLASGQFGTDLAVTLNTFGGQHLFGVLVHGAGNIDDNLFADNGLSSTTYQALFAGGSTPPLSVSRNSAAVTRGTRGIILRGTGTSATNNMVSVTSPAGITAMIVTGGVAAHNTLRATGGSDALEVQGGGSVVRNNLLLATGTGRAIRVVVAGGLNQSDGNDLFTSGPTLVANGGATHATLAAWQGASGLDGASVSEAVTFVNTTTPLDLHLAGASLTTPTLLTAPFADVPRDIDFQYRDPLRVRMGADEGTPLPALDNADTGGAYEIAGTAPDFATPQEFFDALAFRGMKGAVTASIRGGTYPLRALLTGSIRQGAAASNPAATPLRIVGASPANRPVLVSSGATFFDNYILELRDLSHVTLFRLDFETASGGDFGTALDLSSGIGGDGVDDLTVTDCVFTGGTPSAFTRGFIEASGASDRLTVESSTFTGGRGGIYSSGSSSGNGSGVVISSNTFVELSQTAVEGQWDGVVIEDNTFQSAAGTAISLREGVGYTIRGNRISQGDLQPNPSIFLRGITLYGMTGTAAAPGLIVNNVVVASRALEISGGTTNARIVHNTLYSAGNISSVAFSVTSGTNSIAELLNNILVQVNGRPVISISAGNSVSASDGNTFYTTGTTFGTFLGTPYASLATYQAAIGLDPNSHTGLPAFVNVAPGGDFHLAPSMAGFPLLAGVAVPAVTTDIDGEARNATRPYAGADELSTPIGTGIVFSLTGQLQGAHQAGGMPMRTALAAADLIPQVQSYRGTLYDGTAMDYDGGESVPAGFFTANPDFVDWVLVELRASPSGPAVARRALLLHRDGAVRDGATTTALAFDVPHGLYHVVLYHRNHLAMMSTARALSDVTVAVSLRTATGVYGGTAAGMLQDGTLMLVAGDGDADGSVLAGDRQSVWLPQVGQTGYLLGDFNMDGNVLADDRQALWAPNVGRQSNVPGASLKPGTPTGTQLAHTTEEGGN